MNRNYSFFKEFVFNLLASTWIFRTTNIFWFLSIFKVFFSKLKTYSETLHFSSAFFGQIEKLVSLFHFVANGFHDFENNGYSKKKQKCKLILSFFFCSTCYLFSLMRPRHTTFCCLRNARLNILWGAKDGFKASIAFSCKFQLNFLCCLFLLFFSGLKALLYRLMWS